MFVFFMFSNKINFFQGPFQSFSISDPPINTWTKLKFSPFDRLLLLNTDSPNSMVIDAFNCSFVYNMVAAPAIFDKNIKGLFYSDFSADECYVFGGGVDGKVHVFDVRKECEKILELQSKAVENITHTQFNPVYKCMVTASNDLVSSFLKRIFIFPTPERSG